MSNYDKDLERFLDAWEQVQQDMQAQDRIEDLATRIGRPADQLKRDLDHVARTLREIGSGLTRKELVDHALKTHDKIDQTKRRDESSD